ncbi:hypothetical protein [Jatrophihabitans sp.]|uniref:hypothetical protein n=1 Tax=Jatrophihabitans sp. TaxID=1932789 RepID=UPI0030C74323|nr:hypothetical protein [Jatrophihabitans sp.]
MAENPPGSSLPEYGSSAPGSSGLSRRKLLIVRALFVILIVGLPVELAISRFDNEPYPALFQPGFAGHPYNHGVLKIVEPTLIVHFADGTVANDVAYQRILPKSGLQSLTVMKNEFYDDHAAKDPRTKVWLRQRLALLFPNRPVATLVILWQQEHIHVNDPKHPIDKPVRTVTVELAG